MTPAPWGRQIESRLGTERLGHPLVAFDELDSTNDTARQMAIAGAPEGLAVVADAQRQGRGRRGRTWRSESGMGVCLSVVLRPQIPPSDVGWLSMLGGVAVADALEQLGLRASRIKWPNDVLVDGRKIAGVLVEPRVGKDAIEFAVAGVGVNVRQSLDDWTAALKHTATSCLMEGVEVTCEDATVRVLEQLDRWYSALLQGKRDDLFEEWARRGGGTTVPIID